MNNKERIRKNIIDILNDEKHHSILEVSEKLNVSWTTVRYHFLELQINGKIFAEKIGKHKYFIIKKPR